MTTKKTILLTALTIIAVSLYFFGKRSTTREAPSPESADSSVPEKIIQPKEAIDNKVSEYNPELTTTPTSPISQKPIITTRFVTTQDPTEPALTDEHTHIIREWKGRFSPDIPTLAASLGKIDEEQNMTLLLPTGEELNVLFGKHVQYDMNRGVLTGKVPGSDFSEVILSYVNQAISGSITRPQTGEVLEIRNAGDGLQYFAQVDTEKLGVCGVCADTATK